jgi:hypothetical protein
MNAADRRAVIVLPPALSLEEPLAIHSRWLTRGRTTRAPQGIEPLLTVLQQLGQSPPDSALAALRWWGQTGARPDGWLCAADPVYLEAMLDHIRLHALEPDRLAADERRLLYEYLQAEFGSATRSFECVGEYGYLKDEQPFATANTSSHALDGREPDAFLPAGSDAREHDRLVGELQLLLHDAAINRRRMERGLIPANSMWFWGGGRAPQELKLELPPLIAGDALFRGCWRAAGADITAWPDDWKGSLPDVLSAFRAGFVAVVPDDVGSSGPVAEILAVVKRLLVLGRIRDLKLYFGDGCLLHLRRPDLLALWRGRSWPHGNEIEP